MTLETMASIKARPVEILMVEDNPGDVRLTEEALKEGRLWNHLIVTPDGIQAMDYLHRTVAANGQRPDLILLDLNLPMKDGREVLGEIKADPDLAYIPVVVLTTSAAEVDVLRSYQLHANCYITKPVDFSKFVSVVRSIEDFWFTVVRLPSAV